MISFNDFTVHSLEVNLFFLRLMKEHSIFLEAVFLPKDKNLINQAEAFKNEFSHLLSHAVTLADGLLPSSVINSKELVTKYTIDAEKATQMATGILIDTSITSRELSLLPISNKSLRNLTDEIFILNKNIIRTLSMLIQFKNKLLKAVLSCNLFINAYPKFLEHLLYEAMAYKELLTRLQNGVEISINVNPAAQEAFWNKIMSEHAFFIRGLLDPTEVNLFNLADSFGKKFEDLRKEANKIKDSKNLLREVTNKSLDAAKEIREFKEEGVEGLLNCEIKAIISPLLADHVLREANHYIRLLRNFNL
ncbi:DUF2935 domain-containing protein [Clostridium isatidis]|uniref:DUF2935 domain-containing protein n=1 Tax=Clostridium isatidis TaxID=182773 RepID=A0A343JF46_9CLOT|nr:DUF2935 domain-containing protein [Clostridium isatidis]ASW44154.1 hypothetical protein BEN51_12000 [Clostridium isatidis]